MLVLGGILGTLGGLLGGIVGGVGSAIVNPIFDAIGHAVGGAAALMVKSMATFWMSTPTPQLATGSASQTPTAPVALIQGHLWWYMTGAAVVGVLVGCGRMAWEQRADAGREVLRGLAVFVATAGAGLTVIALAITAADQFATWIVSASTGGNFGTEVGKLTTLTVIAGGGLYGVILVCVFGLLMIVASLIQMVLMIVRGGMLVILAGVLPTTAAFTSTQAGRHWFRKSCGWLVAFILYKPAAAIVYATAFSLAGNGSLGGGRDERDHRPDADGARDPGAAGADEFVAAPMVGATAAGGAGAVLGAAAGGAAGAAAMLAGPSGALRGVGGGSQPGWPGAGPRLGGAGLGRCGEWRPMLLGAGGSRRIRWRPERILGGRWWRHRGRGRGRVRSQARRRPPAAPGRAPRPARRTATAARRRLGEGRRETPGSRGTTASAGRPDRRVRDRQRIVRAGSEASSAARRGLRARVRRAPPQP